MNTKTMMKKYLLMIVAIFTFTFGQTAMAIVLPPVVTTGNINVSGAIGDHGEFISNSAVNGYSTVMVEWDNSATGDNNSGVSDVTVDFSQFEGMAVDPAFDDGGVDVNSCDSVAGDDIWTACFDIDSHGSLDDVVGLNVSVTATNAGGSTTVMDDTNATVDNVQPADDQTVDTYSTDATAFSFTGTTSASRKVYYEIWDDNGLYASDYVGQTADGSGDYTINEIDISGAIDGTINLYVWVQDSAGNYSPGFYDAINFNKTGDVMGDYISNVATITADTYTVSDDGGGAETITDVPFGTTKADFLTDLTGDDVNQVWDDSDLSDPIVTGDTLVVTAQDTTTVITYTVTVNAETYTVTFNTQGGSAVAPIAGINSGDTITLPAAPTKALNTFASWNTIADGSGSTFDATTAVVANITVYAQWTPLSSVTTTDPTGDKMREDAEAGYLSITGIDPTNTAKVTYNVDYTLQSGSASVYFPAGTEMTKTGGGNLDLIQMTTQDITASLNSALTTDVLGAVKIGIPNMRLTFSKPITVTIPVGVAYNGQTLNVYFQNDDETSWNSETTCVVSGGNCSFQTTHATKFSSGRNRPSSGGGSHSGHNWKMFKFYRDNYKTIARKINYTNVKNIKKSNPAEFERLKANYAQYYGSGDSGFAKLSLKIQNDYKIYKNYRGYKLYLQYRDRVGE